MNVTVTGCDFHDNNDTSISFNPLGLATMAISGSTFKNNNSPNDGLFSLVDIFFTAHNYY